MIVYIEAAEDMLNLDEVECIEFRDERGNIPAREWDARRGLWVRVTDEVSRAAVQFRSGRTCTYHNSAARELQAICHDIETARE